MLRLPRRGVGRHPSFPNPLSRLYLTTVPAFELQAPVPPPCDLLGSGDPAVMDWLWATFQAAEQQHRLGDGSPTSLPTIANEYDVRAMQRTRAKAAAAVASEKESGLSHDAMDALRCELVAVLARLRTPGVEGAAASDPTGGSADDVFASAHIQAMCDGVANAIADELVLEEAAARAAQGNGGANVGGGLLMPEEIVCGRE